MSTSSSNNDLCQSGMAYLIIIMVSLNVYLYTVKWSLEDHASREKNALLAQLLFWPLVLGGYCGLVC